MGRESGERSGSAVAGVRCKRRDPLHRGSLHRGSMEAKDVPHPDSTPPATPPERPRGELLDFPMRGDRNQNPPGMSLLALLREDLRTHESPFAHGFVAIAVNRLGNWRMGLPKLLRFPFSLLHDFVYALTLWTARIELPYIVKVGRRVRIWHN